jgi:vacuolar protein sorting-associated protein 45
MLYGVVDSALKSKLPITEYPIMGGMPYDSRSATIPASNVIVFVVGGTTYEEAKEVAMSFNQGVSDGGVRVILGGNFVHNSKSFMADIS